MYDEEKIQDGGIEISQMIVPIIGDGACLFNSLSFILYNRQERSQKVRNTIVSFVAENWNVFYWLSHDSNGDNFSTPAEYVREMSQPTTYGGTCELTAAGEIHPYFFKIYRSRHLYTEFGNPISPVRSFTGNINSGHFEVYLPVFEDNIKQNLDSFNTNLPITRVPICENLIPSNHFELSITTNNVSKEPRQSRGRSSKKKNLLR